jgi:hypothetical protein
MTPRGAAKCGDEVVGLAILCEPSRVRMRTARECSPYLMDRVVAERLLGRVPRTTALRKRPSADVSMVSVNGSR